MGFIVAIESDPKTVKDFNEAMSDLARSLNHKVVIFKDLNEFKTTWAKPENEKNAVALLMIPAEAIGATPQAIETINLLKETYKADVVVTLFDDPRFTKVVDTWPVQNLIFKPYDLTILKEHTRFALLKNQKVQTQYVHTTRAKAEIESLKKLKSLQLTEFGFKMAKFLPLITGEVYKFYHPLFANGKQTHMWGRVVAEHDQCYEVLFAQVNPTILSSTRKKIVSTVHKLKNETWSGRKANTSRRLVVSIQVTEEGLTAALSDLLNRNYENLFFLEKKDIKGRAKVDLLITDIVMDRKYIDNNFEQGLTVIQLTDNKPLKRPELEARFSIETVRMEKPVDKALLVRFVKQLFPLIKEKEQTMLTTVGWEEPLLQSSLIEIEEYSEAAVAFKLLVPIPIDTMLDITFSQEDETLLKEMKAKVHYVDEKPRTDKSYSHQIILFGMKDEFLKLIRLWTLQRHIANSKNG